MTWWTKWLRRQTTQQPTPDTIADTGLKLGTGDRLSFAATTSSDHLARKVLEVAREKAKHLPAGSQVTVDITDDHRDVHHMELCMSFIVLASEYGVHLGVQFDNSLIFYKD